jgi:hypothetical protein
MANFFDDLYQKVFNSFEKTSLNHKENFELKAGESEQAHTWSQSTEGELLLEKIYKNHALKKLQLNERPEVHILDSKYASGFAITYDEPLTPETFSLLFLAFAQRVLALGYAQVSLDRKLEEINEQVRSTEKFYFKPPLQIPEENILISQLYGNVAIEKITLNNQPSYLKVLATFYSDRLYEDPMPFDEFMDRLFEKN